VFSNWPFFSICNIANVSPTVLYVCSVSSMCFELYLFLRFRCSLYRTYVLFVRRILVDTRYISVGKFHSDYMCLLFSHLVLGGILLYR
jgi:hypothetical protein